MKAPNFFLAGHPKCGTTTLYEYLALHPEVFMPDVKEPAYFSNRQEYQRGLSHYLELHYQSADGFRAIGDATPWYAPIPVALQRIQADLPSTSHRFVLILRDPADRAYSMYWDQVRVGRETREFDAVIQEELEQKNALPPDDQHDCRTRYLWTSRYERHIKTMDEVFGADASLILIQDDLADDDRRQLLLRALAAFLGVEAAAFPQDERRANVAKAHRSPRLAKTLSSPGPIGKFVRSLVRAALPVRWRRRVANRLTQMNYQAAPYPAMNSSHREQLNDYFVPTTDFVEQRIGRTLPSWRSTKGKTP